jgi:hypothetical protein
VSARGAAGRGRALARMHNEWDQTPPPVAVIRWRDLPGARKGMPAGLLAVLVAGQHAGAIARAGDGWVACHQARTLAPARETQHASSPT